MNPQAQVRQTLDPNTLARRWFFQQCGVGLASLAFADLLASPVRAQVQPASGGDPLAPRTSHHPPRAKQVIFLFMAGAPSHLEMFDYKPQLEKYNGTLPPAELVKGYRAAFINPSSKLLGPKSLLSG